MELWRRQRRSWVWFWALAAAGGCGAGGDKGGFSTSVETTQVFQSSLSRKLDVVVVVGNASSMAPLRDRFIAGLSSFIDALKAGPGGLPSLHLAVVSSNVGPGRYDLPDRRCAFQGDGGRFQAAAQVPCTATGLGSTDRFLSTSGGDQSVKNYAGDITDALACIARLPSTGCAFGGPLKALRWAIDPLNVPDGNFGFLRPDAALLAILVANQDDCSTPDDSDLFDPNQTRLADPLGPLSTFRCNEFGHLCMINGTLQPPPRAAASNLLGCVSNDTSTSKLTPVSDEISFLRSLKPDPSQVSVAIIAGPSTPYGITTRSQPVGTATENQPAMVPSCTTLTPDDGAAPAVRLAQWAGSFGAKGVLQSACATSLAPALDSVGKAATVAFHNCFHGTLIDGDITTPQIDPICQVVESYVDDTGKTRSARVPACTSTSDPTSPCWRLNPEPSCTPEGLEFLTMRSTLPPSGSAISVSCETCPAGKAVPGCPTL